MQLTNIIDDDHEETYHDIQMISLHIPVQMNERRTMSEDLEKVNHLHRILLVPYYSGHKMLFRASLKIMTT